ncbi:HipA family kinase [Cupriavidus sp. amp6]|uniref:HipA family kinase n=1 Tax=Cupriavidus sp. amp6 TaxID=388051 RepID=UPI00048BDE3F|nr:HipA family kinase [Cupriavidus sp. amp6]
MLELVTATRFIKPMESGRTAPLLLECEGDDERPIEIVTKCSAGTMEGVQNLAIEAVASMLAADLALPVPEPFIVSLTPEFIDLMAQQDAERAEFMRRSHALAFGSRRLPNGFVVWVKGQTVPANLCTEAAEIFAFDGIIVNADRRPENPNCLFSGSNLAIFDHELTFNSHQVLFWRAPWEDGGFDNYASPERHIFAKPNLATCPENLDRFVQAWEDLPDERFEAYFSALPPDWLPSNDVAARVIPYLADVKQNIRILVDEALGVLR